MKLVRGIGLNALFGDAIGSAEYLYKILPERSKLKSLIELAVSTVVSYLEILVPEPFKPPTLLVLDVN